MSVAHPAGSSVSPEGTAESAPILNHPSGMSSTKTSLRRTATSTLPGLRLLLQAFNSSSPICTALRAAPLRS